MASRAAPGEGASLRGLMESREVGFAGWDAKGRIVDANEAFARLLGFGRDELLASRATWRSLTPPEYHAAEDAAIAETECSGFTRDHFKEFVRRDGSRVWALLAFVRTASERSTHAILVLDDSERRSAAQVLRHNWRMYRQFLDSAPDLVVIRDRHARIFWANRAFLEFHRTSQEAIAGRIAPPGRTADATERELRALATVRETGEPVELPPEPLRRTDGAVRFFYTTCQLFPDAMNDRLGSISISRDSTGRAHAEQALARSETNLRMAQAIAHIGSWEIHLSNRGDDYWSAETFRILGIDPTQQPYSPERYLDEIVHPEDREVARAALAELMQDRNQLTPAPYRIVRPDGSIRWVESEAQLVHDSQGELESIVGTIRDVTDAKLAEATREQLESRLRQAQKLEAVGTLAGGIAHDFNNILSAVSGYAELVLDASRDNPAAQADLQHVLLAASRAANLVSRILTFSRQQEVRRRPLDLERPIGEAVLLLRATLPRTIEMKVSIDPKTPSVSADETQMLQVMMNLGTNALHGMQEQGGVLEVRLDPFVVTPELATLQPQLSPGLHARLSVSDTGVGIEPHLLDRILEPFFTTKPPGLGTGLGLSVVHGIVLDHDGALEVESVPNAGTTVRVYLPALATPAPSTSSVRIEPPRGRGQRVLVVDDEEALAELSRRRLEELGYAPLAFTESRLALAAVQQEPAHFDLVLTDYTMPHLTGIELAKEIRALRPDLPVILLSGHGDAVHPANIEASGIRGHLSKPVDRRTLAEAIAAALGEARS